MNLLKIDKFKEKLESMLKDRKCLYDSDGIIYPNLNGPLSEVKNYTNLIQIYGENPISSFIYDFNEKFELYDLKLCLDDKFINLKFGNIEQHIMIHNLFERWDIEDTPVFDNVVHRVNQAYKSLYFKINENA